MRYLVPAIVGIMYAAQGAYHLHKGEYGFSIMWLAYAAANVGLCMAMANGQEGH